MSLTMFYMFYYVYKLFYKNNLFSIYNIVAVIKLMWWGLHKTNIFKKKYKKNINYDLLKNQIEKTNIGDFEIVEI
jgi:hypothetical protein